MTACSSLRSVYASYDFPIHILLALVAGKIYPPLGAVYVHPEITATWLAVIVIFIIVGLGLKTKELAAALQRLHFNLFVQLYNFVFVSFAVYWASRGLVSIGVLNRKLADGLTICSCLPMAINCLIVLTGSTGGDGATAIFNTSFANIFGIFISPMLILYYLGASGSVDIFDTFTKLTFIVILPMLVGWIFQNYVEPVRKLYVKHRKVFKKTQESCLVFIIWTVFSKSFLAGEGGEGGASLADALVMIVIEFLLMVTLMGIAWHLLGLQFPNEPELRVTGLFCCHQKTVALGVPLINSMYGHDPNVALYTLPVLVWHPMQLVFGSFLVPALSSYIRTERERISVEEREGEIGVVGESTPLVV
jgi:solute carrier family 10 (sodium/bile acid cotransporter), member 7